MKNWKYIDGAKVGNIKDDKKSQQLWEEMQHAKKLAEDWAREIHRTGKEEYKGSQKDAEEAYRKAKREYEKYAMNAKTGNAESFDEFVKKLAKEKPELYQSLWNAGQMEALKSYYHKITGNEKTGAEGFFKQLSDDVKEREKKDDEDIEKVGNANLETSVEKGKLGLWNWYVHKDGTIVSGGTSSTEANAKEMARKALEKEKAGNKVGNKTTQVAQVGTVKIFYDDKDDVYYTNVGGSIFNNPSFKTKEEAVKYTVQKNKVGNALNWDENLVGKFVWVKDKGQEWKVYVMQDKGDKVYIRDDDGSQGWVSKTRITGKVGNSKIGNSTVGNTVVKTIKDFEIDVEKRPGENYWRWYVDHKNGDNLDSGFENSKEEAIRAAEQKINSGNFRSPVRNNKISNSASEDKFAYVMREFDEGKLKTPDGKVVTDPEQAKAIAYSESKKTENGLARARNAIKKS